MNSWISKANLRFVELFFHAYELLLVQQQVKHEASSWKTNSSFLLVKSIYVDTSKVQNILKDDKRPCTCLHCRLSWHLVSNINPAFSFVVKCNSFLFLFVVVVSTIKYVWSVLRRSSLFVYIGKLSRLWLGLCRFLLARGLIFVVFCWSTQWHNFV